jgi:hypothetical protein
MAQATNHGPDPPSSSCSRAEGILRVKPPPLFVYLPHQTHSLNQNIAPLAFPNTTPLPPGRNVTRRPRKARRDIQGRIPEEEMARPQQQRHGLGGHDGEVLRGREMGEAEGVPEDDVGVGDVLRRVRGDPRGDAV